MINEVTDTEVVFHTMRERFNNQLPARLDKTFSGRSHLMLTGFIMLVSDSDDRIWFFDHKRDIAYPLIKEWVKWGLTVTITKNGPWVINERAGTF
jgi:hypothetical protein